MALLAVEKPGDFVAHTPTYQTPTATGDTIPNRRVWVLARNTDVVARIITVKSHAAVRPGIMRDDLEHTVPAGGSILIRGFGAQEINSPTNEAELTYDAITGLTLAVFE
jgi:hypothetical protein